MNAIPPKGLDPKTAACSVDATNMDGIDFAIPESPVSDDVASASTPPEQPGWARGSGVVVPAHLSAIEVTLSVEVGSRKLPLRDLLAVEPGELFSLDRMTAEPVDILVNGRSFARGEVVAIGERYGVRLTALVDPQG
ncbi:MAG: FliM/FliN family flagellar motor switch protein [Sphingomonadaceae bacterium]